MFGVVAAGQAWRSVPPGSTVPLIVTFRSSSRKGQDRFGYSPTPPDRFSFPVMTDTSVSIEAASRPEPPSDWRLQIPEWRRRPMRAWLWSVALMTLGVVVVGGITRLTLSGLSIVDWDPLVGVIPPLSESAWQEAFARYQQFPEYRSWRGDMTLDQFKSIYFWEYLHRLLARTIGLVFVVPFVVFWARGWLDRPLLRRALLLFGLGTLQGLMGWLMVQSGLVDRPAVSHYRLAAHLSLAFLIFGLALWLIRELSVGEERVPVDVQARHLMERGLAVVGTLLAVQIVWGAFVAGLRGGKFYPTFPLMGGRWVPRELFYLDDRALNFIANPIAVQWAHRVIGTALLLAVLAFVFAVLRAPTDAHSRRYSVALLVMVAVQYALGILTLLARVPVSLGVAHQATALLLFAVWLAWLHHVRNTAVRESTAP